MTRPLLILFTRDLRLDDHPALIGAEGRPALLVYCFDERARPLGGAARWQLHHSLAALGESIEKRGGRLDIVAGKVEALIPALALASGASEARWGRGYGGADIAAFIELKATLTQGGVKASSFNTRLIREPWEVVGAEGRPLKVFTPFWRRLRGLGPLPAPIAAPERLQTSPWPDDAPPRLKLDDLRLLPVRPDWAGGLRNAWTPGEAAAQARLGVFIDAALADYAEKRDRPDGDFTSRLSPHLAFGEISPRRIAAVIEAAAAREPRLARGAEKFLAEIGWREFAYSLLYAAPDLATEPWAAKFAAFPFRDDAKGLEAWRRGETGYPLVDAGMRELWATGFMHNRVRMVAASFLVKHLLIDWRRGEEWFWDTLCDADEANNPAGWQWVAGSGADAAPYFRIFNPVLQGEKFDPNGDYVRRWVPELAKLPAATIHKPWKASLRLDYPAPIVDHDFARRRALDALKEISGS